MKTTNRLGVLVVAILVTVTLGSGVVAALKRSAEGPAPVDPLSDSGAFRAGIDDEVGYRFDSAQSVPSPATSEPEPGGSNAKPRASSEPKATSATVPAVPPPPLWRPSVVHSSSVSDYGPVPAGAVEVAPTPNQSSWSAVSNGVSLVLRMEPAAPTAGEPVRFTMEVSSSTSPCCGIDLLYGDGYDFIQGMWACPGTAAPRSPGTASAEVTHVFPVHGRMVFMLTALTGNCEATGPVGIMFGTLEVAEGSATSQGPALPQVKVDQTTPEEGHLADRSYLNLFVMASDGDGHISRLIVDWGDGSPIVVLPGDSRPCKLVDFGGQWPIGSLVFVPGPAHPVTVHHFEAPGTYRLTVTAFSTGCDGADEQQGSGTFTQVVPAP